VEAFKPKGVGDGGDTVLGKRVALVEQFLVLGLEQGIAGAVRKC